MTTEETLDPALTEALLGANFFAPEDLAEEGAETLSEQLVRTWLNELTDDQRLVLSLLRGIGREPLPPKEAATELGIADSTATSRAEKAALILHELTLRPDNFCGLEWRVRRLLRDSGIFDVPAASGATNGRFSRE